MEDDCWGGEGWNMTAGRGGVEYDRWVGRGDVGLQQVWKMTAGWGEVRLAASWGGG